MTDRATEWTVKHEQRKMEQDMLITESKKRKFINEITGGLGELIKEEPNKPQKKLKWYQKLIKMFKNT